MLSQHASSGKALPQSKQRIDALKAKHAALSKKINDAEKGVSTSDLHIRALKKEKLKLKELIEGIRNTSGSGKGVVGA